MIRSIILGLLLLSLLTACASEPVYTPDQATLAQREQAEYDSRMSKLEWTFRAFYVATIIGLGILLFLLFSLAKIRREIYEAEASKANAEARRAMLVDLGNGAVLDLETDQIRQTNIITAPQILPARRAEPLPAQPERNTLVDFVADVVAINDGDWHSDVIPRHDRWAEIGKVMTPVEWMRHTDELAQRGLIEKAQGRRTTTVGSHDMATIYESITNRLPHSSER